MVSTFLAGHLGSENNSKKLLDIKNYLLNEGIEVICPLDVNFEPKEKMSWVREKIENSDYFCAYINQVTFGTSTEIGMAIILNKKIFLICEDKISNTLNNHLTIKGTQNLTIIKTSEMSNLFNQLKWN